MSWRHIVPEKHDMRNGSAYTIVRLADMKITKKQAETELISAGWKKLYPNTPLYDHFWYDGVNKNWGMAWLSAYTELMRRRRQPQQLPLFSSLTPHAPDDGDAPARNGLSNSDSDTVIGENDTPAHCG